MARPLRIEYEGSFYHITARGAMSGKGSFSQRLIMKNSGTIWKRTMTSMGIKALLHKKMKNRGLRKATDKISRKMAYVKG